MDYKELAKSLRNVVCNRDGKCEGCRYEEDFPCCVDCLDKMHREAADAIEELSMVVDNLNFLNKHPWIPVTERLPEEYKEILMCSAVGSIMIGFYDPEIKGFLDMSGFRFIITHWMPLPGIPKEETE